MRLPGGGGGGDASRQTLEEAPIQGVKTFSSVPVVSAWWTASSGGAGNLEYSYYFLDLNYSG